MPRWGTRRFAAIASLVTVIVVVACGDGQGADRSAQLRTPPLLRPLTPSSVAPATPASPVAPSHVPAHEPTTTVATLRRFTVLAAGDVLSHTSVIRQATSDAGGIGYDWAPMFEPVRSIIERADVAICHLETPVAPPGTEIDGVVPTFGVPAEVAVGIKAAGFDRCSLASNHTMDKGAAGIDATVTAFDAAGLGHAGMARNPDEALPSIFDANGVTVAHISATYSYNGNEVPAGEPWRSNLIDPTRIIAEAGQARVAGAQVVILSLHWGQEGNGEVTSEQRSVAEQITASGTVDLIIGHHAHVAQPIEQVNGRWVVFGMGNLLSGMGDSTDCCGVRALDGMLVRTEIAEQQDGTFVVGRPEVVPTYLTRSPYRIVSVSAAINGTSTAGTATSDELWASLQRTNAVVGAFLAPG